MKSLENLTVIERVVHTIAEAPPSSSVRPSAGSAGARHPGLPRISAPSELIADSILSTKLPENKKDYRRTEKIWVRMPQKRQGPRLVTGGLEIKSGSVLLSHTVARAVPSAQEGLTSEFGMGSGVTPPPLPPECGFQSVQLAEPPNETLALNPGHFRHLLDSTSRHRRRVESKNGQAARPISTGRLHALLRFYLRPINLLV